MAEKKTATAKAEPKKAATTAKKTTTTTKKVAVKKELVVNAEHVGFRAGDVYQALAAANKALSVADIAKAAKISFEDALLGLGWLLKEGKIKDEANLITLA